MIADTFNFSYDFWTTLSVKNDNYPVHIITPEYIEDDTTPEENMKYPMGEFDAYKWAAQFKKVGVELGLISPDLDAECGSWLHTWFCCAIMTGFDCANQRNEAMEELDEWESELEADLEYCFWGV